MKTASEPIYAICRSICRLIKIGEKPPASIGKQKWPPWVRSLRRAFALFPVLVVFCFQLRAIAQTTPTVTWAGGNSYKSWFAASNWSSQIGPVVPLNAGGTNFTVIVPDSTTVAYDSATTGTIDALSFGNSAGLKINGGGSLLVNGSALIRGALSASGAGSTFTTVSPQTVFSGAPTIATTSGGHVGVAASSYSWPYYNGNNGGTLLSSIGSGSRIDLTNLSSFAVNYGDGGSWTYAVNARSNGVIDMSNLGQITGAGQDDWLDFNIDTGGNILLGNLGQMSGRVHFNVTSSYYELTKLNTDSGTYFNVGTNSMLSAPSLLNLLSGNIQVSDGASFQAPQLVTLDTVGLVFSGSGAFLATNLNAYRNSDISFAPGRNFQLGPLADVFASRIFVSGGTTGRVAALSYNTPNPWNINSDITLFSADGVGSLLDLSSIVTMTTHYDQNRCSTISVNAKNNGIIDLSGLTTLNGPEAGCRELDFNIQNSGNIRLGSLHQIFGYARFNVNVPQFSLPVLQSASTTTLSIGAGDTLSLPQAASLASCPVILADGARLDAPQMQSFTSASVTWGFNSTLNAPNLVDVSSSGITWAPGQNLIAPPFTNIFAAELYVTGGTTGRVAALSYNTPNPWNINSDITLFSADGVRSLLDLSSIVTMTTHYDQNRCSTISVNAKNNGIIDLSGLTTLNGPEASCRLLQFTVSNAGVLKFGNVSLSSYLALNASGTASALQFAGLYVRVPAQIGVGTKAVMQLRGDFLYENTDPNSIVDEGAYFQMDGARPQRLEVGGRDAGPGGYTTRNFGYSQLIVGSSNQTSVVRLVDTINNGNRGASGEPEALYLYGMDGAGLRILNGSKLVLGNINCYAQVSGQMLRLNSLILPGSNSVAFDQGFLATTSGPRITNSTPVGSLLPSIDHVDVTFDIPIAPGSFTAADVKVEVSGSGTVGSAPPNLRIMQMSDGRISVSWAGTGGALQQASSVTGPWSDIPGASSPYVVNPRSPLLPAVFFRATGGTTGITNVSVTQLSDRIYRISFPPQTADGTYSLGVGPNITDAAGNLTQLDQDGDGNAGEAVDDVFHTSFTLDSTPPSIAGAYALQNGTWVGVTFSEAIAPAWATNVANYSVNSTTPIRAVLQTNGFQVALQVSALAGVNFPLGVTGLTDPLGNQTNLTFTGTILSLSATDIGSAGSDPVVAGSTVPYGPGYFDMVAGGSTIWGSQDAGQFAYETRTGDFDIGVRIAEQTLPNQYAEAGLMVRPALASNSRCVYHFVQSHNAANTYALASRPSDGGSMVGWPGGSTNTSGVPLPNAWMRLKRQGDLFTAFRSSNGVDWLMMGQLTNGLPATLLVGPASSADVNSAGQSTTVWYRDYQDFGPSILTQPQSQTVTSGVAVVFGVTVRGQPTLGYQWFFNGLPLPSETNSLLTLPNIAVTNAGDYRVVVTNGYGSVTSLPATLVVNGIGLGGFEGDLMPRPNGNNAVTISDWVEVGLLVVGLDSVLNSSEFMRADCAPRMVGTNLTLGDGRLTVADWTQAGRYAAGLDPVTAAGGPSAPVSGSFAPRLPTQKDNSTRSLQAGTVTVWQGGTIQVPVFLTSQGNENALGFSLGFDPSRLTFRDATAGAGAAGAFMQVNAQNAASGQVGIALANQVGQQFSTGRVEVARLQFTAGSVTGNVAAVFVDQPVFREIVDTRAAPLECAYVDGSVQIILAPRFSGVQAIAGGGISLTISGPAGQGCVLQGSSDLVSWTSLSTNVFTASPLVINDPGAPAHSSRFYRLMPSP